MTILNFVTQEQLDGLDDDPKVAFMELCNFAQRSFTDQTRDLDLENNNDWEVREDLRRTFMNVIVASAKRFGVEPFASSTIPRRDSWNSDIYLQFKEDLDHYVTQIVIDNSFANRKESVAILPKTRDQISGYITALRDCIEQATISEVRKSRLLKRLDDLEKELIKSRTNMLVVARVVFEVLSIPGNMWASYDITHRLTSQIVQTVAEAKTAEQESKPLAPVAPMKELSPPRNDKPEGGSFGVRPSFGGKSPMEDDDIPF